MKRLPAPEEVWLHRAVVESARFPVVELDPADYVVLVRTEEVEKAVAAFREGFCAGLADLFERNAESMRPESWKGWSVERINIYHKAIAVWEMAAQQVRERGKG